MCWPLGDVYVKQAVSVMVAAVLPLTVAMMVRMLSQPLLAVNVCSYVPDAM